MPGTKHPLHPKKAYSFVFFEIPSAVEMTGTKHSGHPKRISIESDFVDTRLELLLDNVAKKEDLNVHKFSCGYVCSGM